MRGGTLTPLLTVKTPVPDPRTGGAGETGGEVLGRNHVRMYIHMYVNRMCMYVW